MTTRNRLLLLLLVLLGKLELRQFTGFLKIPVQVDAILTANIAQEAAQQPAKMYLSWTLAWQLMWTFQVITLNYSKWLRCKLETEII